jgi:hypothetical protein
MKNSKNAFADPTLAGTWMVKNMNARIQNTQSCTMLKTHLRKRMGSKQFLGVPAFLNFRTMQRKNSKTGKKWETDRDTII